MVHFCMFGGHSSELTGGRKVYVTLFGGCELKRPTLAREIINGRTEPREQAVRAPGRHFFVTLFGATELKSPTLAEEFLDLEDAVKGNLVRLEEWDWAVSRLASLDSHHVGSLTLFGAFEAAELPSEEEELDAMALNNYVGRMPESAVNVLRLGVGQRGSSRTAVVRQAVACARVAPA